MIVSMKVFCGATCPLLIGISAAVLRSGGMTIRRLLLNGAISVYWPVLVVVNLKILVNPAQLRLRRRRRQRRDSMSAPRRRRSFRSELGGPLVRRVRRRSLARSLVRSAPLRPSSSQTVSRPLPRKPPLPKTTTTMHSLTN